MIKTNSIYRHFKGNEYRVLGIARDSETQNKLVIYSSTCKPEELWARPYEMFDEIILRDGKEIRRFTEVS